MGHDRGMDLCLCYRRVITLAARSPLSPPPCQRKMQLVNSAHVNGIKSTFTACRAAHLHSMHASFHVCHHHLSYGSSKVVSISTARCLSIATSSSACHLHFNCLAALQQYYPSWILISFPTLLSYLL